MALRDQPIRRQVVAAACLVILPLASVVVWSAVRTRDERVAEAAEQAGSLAVSSAASLDQYIAGLEALGSSLAMYKPVVERREAEVQRLFDNALRTQPLLLNIVLTGAEDAGDFQSGLPPNGNSINPERTFVRQVMAAGHPLMSDYRVGRISHKPTVVLGVPVRDEHNTIVTVLGLAVDLLKLQEQFRRIPLPEDSVVTVIDESNRILTRSRDTEKYVGTMLPAIDRGTLPLTAESMDVDGVDRFYGEAQVTRAPWVLRVGIPRAVIQARLFPLWRRNLLIAALAFAMYLILAVWLAAIGSHHLNQLRLATQRIAGGDLSPVAVPPAPNLELAEFHRSLGTMAANLRNAQDALSRQVQQERELNERLQSLQGQVVRQERLAAVGLLASGVAHEINNPLQALLGATELLERTSNLPPATSELVSFVKTQGARAREIIRGLSRFSSQQPGKMGAVDLRDVVSDVLRFVAAGNEYAGVTIDVDLAGARAVSANQTELEQVTLNLVVNALQAVSDAAVHDGRVAIRLVDGGSVDGRSRVRVEVEDNGHGVKPEDEPKLFQPFFTTKPVGKGTGLGLSVSYGIIRALGGTLGYRRNSDRGAMFYFELPAVDVVQPAHT